MFDTHPELEYVGFWARFWASVIDTFLVLLIVGPLMYGFAGGAGWVPGTGLGLSGGSGVLADYVLPAAATVLFWLYKRATPGKMAVAAQVVDARTGGTLTTGQAIGRYLAYYLSALPLCLGFVWVALDPRKQGWHDKLAGTVVVRPRRPGSVSPPVSFG